jgi:multiple sugar transport system permease protein
MQGNAVTDLAQGNRHIGRSREHAASPARRSWLQAACDRYFATIMSLPTAAVMLIVFGLPLLFSFCLSFLGWTASKSIFGGTFAGLDNYQEIFTDPAFIESLIITLIYTAASVTLEMALGLAVALLMNIDVPLVGLFRALMIIPMTVTPIVAALCWKLLLDPEYGLVDFLLGQKIVWIGDPFWAPFAVGLVNVWQNVPYVAILLLAGLRSLPTEPRDAAAIDGASRLQVFRHITLPLLSPVIGVALLLRVIFEFRAFDNVYVMTGGGPAGATNLLSLYTYTTTFVQFDFTLGAAASWVMLFICLLLCVALVRLTYWSKTA